MAYKQYNQLTDTAVYDLWCFLFVANVVLNSTIYFTRTHLFADNGNYAYNNAAFQSDSESQGQHRSQNPNESQQEGQPGGTMDDLTDIKTSTKSKYDEFGSTTYLNQVCTTGSQHMHNFIELHLYK